MKMMIKISPNITITNNANGDLTITQIDRSYGRAESATITIPNKDIGMFIESVSGINKNLNWW